MKEKKECKVIQDLLPTYVENLTNEETNNFIKEHLKTCEDCKKALDSMQKEIKVNGQKPDNREIKFMKKYKRKLKILSGIILFAVIIYLAFIIRNFIILSSLENKQNKNWNNDNYHVITYNYHGDSLSIIDLKYKEGKYLQEMISLRADEKIRIIECYNGDKANMYIETPSSKFVQLNVTSMPIHADTSLFSGTSNIFEKLMVSMIFNIKKEECNGVKCYRIIGNRYEESINSKIGTLVRREDVVGSSSSGTFNNLTDYKYEFGTVTDEDLMPPDLSEYEVR